MTKGARLLLVLIFVQAASLWSQTRQPWQIGPFTRPSAGNPVIVPDATSTFIDPIAKKATHWEALHTFNPAAIVRDGKIVVLYRAEDDSGAMEIGGHTSRLGVAESSDGIHFTRRATPIFFPANDKQKSREWPGGVEDPRIVESEDGTYVLTYTQWNHTTYSVGIASSRDLEHWTKYGPAFLKASKGKYAALKYKSAGIVTLLDKDKDRLIAAKIDGKYWMYWGEGFVHLATSSDLIHWTPIEDAQGKPLELLHPRPGHFDSTFPETGPPPVLTDAGIVVMYNGKNAVDGGDPALGANAYAAGEALFDAHDPRHLIAQADHPDLKPELPYEKTGQYVAGTTFAEGLVYFHNQWLLYYGCADSLVSVATAPTTPFAGEQGFYLKNNDTVVFYGDSITEQNLYTQYVQYYAVTRFPSLRMHFYTSGVGGDRVSGGGGGPIDERLSRDVFQYKPSVVTIMLGMNDGAYGALTDKVESTYTTGFEHILQSIHSQLPAARVTLLGPSPFDDVTRPAKFAGGYNEVMNHFADLDSQLAKKYDATFTSLNPSVVASLEKAQALDPMVAKLLLPDRVHPDALAHWVMAEALLKGWNAPALVSDVTIDAKATQATDVQNATVASVSRTADGLTWSETENALPLAFIGDNASQAVLLKISDIQQQLDRETLRVTGLDGGSYSLAIDGSSIGTFAAAALTSGINLAEYATPMRGQSQQTSWLIHDRDEAHHVHLRMEIRKFNTGAQPGSANVISEFEDSLEDSIYKMAAPKPHTYVLTRIVDKP